MQQPSPIGRLWRERIVRYPGDLALLAPVLAVVAAAGVSYALILKYATDGIAAGLGQVVVLAPLAVLAATAARAAGMWGQAVLSQSLALKVLRDLQGAMFEKVTSADFARAARETPGALASRFTNDVNVVSEALVRGAQATIRDTLTLMGAIASMLWFDWILTLVVAAVFALAGRPLQRIAQRAHRQTENAQAQIGALSSLLTESFGAARMVRSYSLEQRENARAAAAFETRRRLAMKLAYNRARTVPLMEIVGGIALAGVLSIAGARILAGEMTAGDLLGIVGAVGVAAPSARALGQFNTVLNEANAALSRIYAVLDEPARVTDRPGAAPLRIREGLVQFDAVGFAYGASAALKGVSFSARRGETVALVGPSGAGKSTIFNLIPRLYDVSEGAVRIDGQDVRDVTSASLRGAIALVSQDAALFDDTVAANIALGRLDASRAEIEAAARAAAAHDFIAALPQGYDSPVGDRGANLSGGERQRIALARAFLRDAPILLLDEATSALDSESEARVQEALTRLSQGRTVLTIAHRLSTVRDADRILALEGGSIVEAGRHDELIARGGLYARLAKRQFQD